ncbi:hypothetical protein CORC01_06385 [Colletotrichum orchidophilum]|uniref:Major facilitator superfamily (MFS) profile domain-containing protein n=1 Tax=Colletotrichum orchidophilum TaxID=1209926 RepID=A0A1G4BAE7_9PEZI|nr:uncharacterized protein CORC01_06385 [Colletotrichum orchidophilum]OHE98389.1 hypothetical protein CORC01_06385 [Colletotrichum orchidophilum]
MVSVNRAVPSEHPGQPSVAELSHATSPGAASSTYSILSQKRKVLVLCLASFAATFPPLLSFIFFPAINDLSQALHVSVGKINLTITSYMIVAGLAPAVLVDLADKIGRRIVYLFMMSVYCIASVGLALQSGWTALFLLRMLQNAGSAAAIAIGYGVVSDIAPPSERGRFHSPNIATAVGPILGGALTSYPGWRGIFWFLSILSGTCLFLTALILPETARSVVGDGSGEVSGLRRSCSIGRDNRFVARSNPQCQPCATNFPPRLTIIDHLRGYLILVYIDRGYSADPGLTVNLPWRTRDPVRSPKDTPVSRVLPSMESRILTKHRWEGGGPILSPAMPEPLAENPVSVSGPWPGRCYAPKGQSPDVAINDGG